MRIALIVLYFTTIHIIKIMKPEKLASIVQKLYDFVVNMCSPNTVNYEIINNDIQKIIESIQLDVLVKQVDKADINDFLTINKCTKLLKYVMAKRLELSRHTIKLKGKMRGHSKQQVYDRSKTDCHGRVHKKVIVSIKDGFLCKSTKRLSRHNLKVLENWFEQNFNYPYLDNISLQSLIQVTDLSKSQIQNWISNRRRKERNVKVSPEIVAFLN